MNSILKCSDISKKYGSIQALKNINFEIFEGERIAILGANGAGKSSLLEIISGLNQASSGQIEIFNQTPGTLSVKERTTYLPQQLEFPSNVKVNEIFNIVQAHYSSTYNENLRDDFGLNKLKNRKCGQLSGGEKRKLSLLCCLIGDPDFLILDEPTASIDIEGRKQIEESLLKFLKRPAKTLFFSSHEMKQVENLAKKIIVLKDGEIIAKGPTEEIKKRFGLKKISFYSKKDFQISSAYSQEIKNGHYIVLGKDSDSILKEILDIDQDANQIEISELDLEEILLRLWEREIS